MRKYIGIIAIVALLGFAYVLTRTNPAPTKTEATENTDPIPTPSPFVSDAFVATPFVPGDQVILLPNYSARKTSEQLQKENACTYLVNAGFYLENGQPVGYFKSTETPLSIARQSSLFDGYIVLNAIGTPEISRSLRANVKYGLQTGPILMENGEPVPLSIRNDQDEVRVAAVIDGNNEIAFVMSRASTLSSFADKITQWAEQEGFALADAINLDGGSASAFRSEVVTYPEISPIGSAFCIRVE